MVSERMQIVTPDECIFMRAMKVKEGEMLNITVARDFFFVNIPSRLDL